MFYFNQILSISLTAAPWLIFGLFIAGLIKALLPEKAIQRWMGKQGAAGICRAAVIGAPLPLCSCGAIPTAMSLHRSGAGRGPTIAFLIGTPGIGVNSVIITYVLLGPFMSLARAFGAVVTAISTGLLVETSKTTSPINLIENCSEKPYSSGIDIDTSSSPESLSLFSRVLNGVIYSFSDLLDDISLWLLIGFVASGLLIAFIPPQMLETYGSGLIPMILLAVIGIPMYICATAVIPIALAMLLAGISPGTALVFLLACPITSAATLGIIYKVMGKAVLVRYVLGIIVTSVLIGLTVDQILSLTSIKITVQTGVVREILPEWLEWTALSLLVVLAIKPLRRTIGGILSFR